MSCGGEALLGGCGCGPGVNAHESYKGDWSRGSGKSYSMSARYIGQDTPLPKTAMTRSYAAEKLYVGKTFERIAETVYSAKPLELFASKEPPIELIPSRLESFEKSKQETYSTSNVLTQRPTSRGSYAYDKTASIKELSTLADVYDKQRLLASKISEAFNSNSIDKLVNTWTN